jgi:PrcB C-terminal
MISARYGMLLLLAALTACAGATTMRVAHEDGDGEAPVALSPAPDEGPRPSSDTVANKTPTPDAVANTRPAETDTGRGVAENPQGYTAYGNGGVLELKRIGQWTRTGISEARRLVIRDANSWAAFWSELGVGDRPTIDFSRNLVLAVSAGQRPSGGYEIAVEGVRETNGELAVQVVETAPGPNCMSTTSLTQPVDVVVIPSVTAKTWSFTERKEVRGCR